MVVKKKKQMKQADHFSLRTSSLKG